MRLGKSVGNTDLFFSILFFFFLFSFLFFSAVDAVQPTWCGRRDACGEQDAARGKAAMQMGSFVLPAQGRSACCRGAADHGAVQRLPHT